MSEITTILTEEELKQIQDIRTQYNNIAFALGENDLKKESLLESYKTLRSQEQAVYNQLTEKYGNGSINLTTGEITPVNE
jgi:hypothetical protein